MANTSVDPKRQDIVHEPNTHEALEERSERVLDLQFVLYRILRYWWLVILVTALGSTKGLWDMHKFSPTQIVKMTIAPVSAKQFSAPTGGAGLAAGAALGVLPQLGFGGANQVTPFDRMLHAMSTIGFAAKMQEKYGLMQRLYGGGWDEANNAWRRPGGREFELKERINEFLSLPVWTAPSIEDLAANLGGLFQVNDVLNTNYKAIVVTNPDPEFAQWLLETIYEEATEYIREQDLLELHQESAFLEDRLSKTEIIELRQALVGMLASQARKEMTLQKGLPFIARTIEAPYISKFLTSPNAVAMVGIPTFAAFAISFACLMLLVLFRHE